MFTLYCNSVSVPCLYAYDAMLLVPMATTAGWEVGADSERRCVRRRPGQNLARAGEL